MNQDGSSFESASSLYSLARVDVICEDIPPIEEKSVPATPLPKPSPAHSASSSSSGSYCLTKPIPQTRPTIQKTLPISKKVKSDSISDDERSEKHYSSSHDEKEVKQQTRPRRNREWNEEERRRKKTNFKLEFDRDTQKALTSPLLRQPSPGFKKISPDDKSALNVLDGTSPSKQYKRFRPKTRKVQRNRSTSGEDSLPRKNNKQTLIKISPEQKPPTTILSSKLSPSKFQTPNRSPVASPRKQKTLVDKRLKAKSTESLRSVSPGSDSVFFSEADLLGDHPHCLHCGKEVEVVPGECAEGDEEQTANGEERPDIVQPPEGFADSPNGIRTPHRLYKKLDKRFRSEDRHADRRHYKSRPDARAKVS